MPALFRWDVASWPAGEAARFDTTPDGRAACLAWIGVRSHAGGVVACEACGGLEGMAVEVLHAGTQRNAALRDFPARLCAAGQPEKLAPVGVIRKLTVILNTMPRNNTARVDHTKTT